MQRIKQNGLLCHLEISLHSLVCYRLLRYLLYFESFKLSWLMYFYRTVLHFHYVTSGSVFYGILRFLQQLIHLNREKYFSSFINDKHVILLFFLLFHASFKEKVLHLLVPHRFCVLQNLSSKFASF